MPPASLTVIAPAKINLYLHVTGRRDDGYHLLDSLTVFADVADQITIHPASCFSLAIEGAYASAFTARDKGDTPQSGNLVVRAAYACASHFNRKLDFRITLHKNLPLASGMGGASADAAAVVWGLIRYWGLQSPPLSSLMPLLLSLGADVPVCYLCQSAHMSGIGEKLQPLDVPEYAAVLVNPRHICPTPEVFKAYKDSGQAFTTPAIMPADFETRADLLSFLQQQKNDLEQSAIERLPVIREVMQQLRATNDVQMVRMSGSGATVFALYPDFEAAQSAAEDIQGNKPTWWVRACMFNRIVRY